MNHWLVKSEPEAYAWADFVHETGTNWTRNNLQAVPNATNSPRLNIVPGTCRALKLR